MPSSRPTYLQGEDIEFYVDIDPKYLTDFERLFAYAYFDDSHHLLTSTEGEFIQMEPDVENSRVKIHIANAVSANPDIMPVGVWTLEIMTVYNETEYRAISYYEEAVDLDLVPARVSGHRILHGASGVMKPAFISGTHIVDYTTNSNNTEVEDKSITPAKQSDLDIVRNTIFYRLGGQVSTMSCSGKTESIGLDSTGNYLFWYTATGTSPIAYNGSSQSGTCQKDPFFNIP